MTSRLAVAVVCLLGATTQDARAEDLTLRLVWCDPTDLTAGSEVFARAEAEQLLARMGAHVAWRRGAAGEVRRSDEIWVVLIGEGPVAHSRTPVLGATLRRRQVEPLVWVRVPHVRAAVGVARTRSAFDLSPSERRLFAIALGRVIAHEVVHVLVPSLPHGHGLMADVLDRRELTSGTIAIESDVVLAFRAALRGDPVYVPSGSRFRAAEP